MGTLPTWQPSYLKDLLAWIANPSISMYGMWDSPTPGLHLDGTVTPGEGGVDLDAKTGTPVYALATGPIVGAGYWNDANHGVITQRVNVPGAGVQDIYYQHITLAPNIAHCSSVGSCSQTITRGQQIGTVGSYGETEIGFNANWGTIWGSSHPSGSTWIRDPRPWIAALLSGSAPPVTSTGGASGTDTSTSGADWTTQLQGYGVKIGLFALALVLVLFGAYVMFKPQADKAIHKSMGIAEKAAVL